MSWAVAAVQRWILRLTIPRTRRREQNIRSAYCGNSNRTGCSGQVIQPLNTNGWPGNVCSVAYPKIVGLREPGGIFGSSQTAYLCGCFTLVRSWSFQNEKFAPQSNILEKLHSTNSSGGICLNNAVCWFLYILGSSDNSLYVAKIGAVADMKLIVIHRRTLGTLRGVLTGRQGCTGLNIFHALGLAMENWWLAMLNEDPSVQLNWLWLWFWGWCVDGWSQDIRSGYKSFCRLLNATIYQPNVIRYYKAACTIAV